LIQFFGDAKLDELVSLFSNAGAEEKEQVRLLLGNVYPMRSTELDKLR
jgi:hypothetical protein